MIMDYLLLAATTYSSFLIISHSVKTLLSPRDILDSSPTVLLLNLYFTFCISIFVHEYYELQTTVLLQFLDQINIFYQKACRAYQFLFYQTPSRLEHRHHEPSIKERPTAKRSIFVDASKVEGYELDTERIKIVPFKASKSEGLYSPQTRNRFSLPNDRSLISDLSISNVSPSSSSPTMNLNYLVNKNLTTSPLSPFPIEKVLSVKTSAANVFSVFRSNDTASSGPSSSDFPERMSDDTPRYYNESDDEEMVRGYTPQTPADTSQNSYARAAESSKDATKGIVDRREEASNPMWSSEPMDIPQTGMWKNRILSRESGDS